MLLLPLLLSILGAAGLPERARAVRIEDLCDVRGVRTNQVIGYGLVVGLNGTGDIGQARFTLQSTAAMLRRLGATIDPRMIQTRNAAAVMVTADLPPFANPGTRIDVVVSSLGNARSLQGGTLLQTPLYGADRRVYAVAQGPLVVGGFLFQGRTGSRVGQNFTTTARVPSGGIVERRVAAPELDGETLVLTLKDPSFVNASRIVEAIGGELGEGTASAPDPGTVVVRVPADYADNQVGLLARVQVLEVEADAPARVVIDERTGTVALGANVRIGEAAVAQGGLTVEIGERFGVSQPNALARGGQTAVVPESDVQATQEDGPLRLVPETATLSDVVAALNAIGARPRDLMAIFQALRAAGALRAEVEVH
ncbi:MAG TPA: flagellar basal body P-ring protein FlgI [Polyangiaceae bacterium LLY-WYZ-14_1]|nr:flagellar basal body P-ring protein FlgI [Polyangiaceae bacterium LLY-WYZ-14_1]